jgi:type I site-specific restriction-modification system R (restriction) subunit
LVGQAIKRYTPLSTTLDIKVPLRHGIRHSDVAKSYLASLSMEKNDFEAINNIGSEFYLMNAMSVGEIPCEAILRQRIDKQANAFLATLKTASIDFLSHINPTLTLASSGHMNVIYAQMKKSGEAIDDSVVLDVVRQQTNELLDESIESIYIGSNLPDPVNISDIDFDALSGMVKRTTKPRISDAKKIKNLIQLKVGPMVERNRTRQHLQEKFQLLIDEYKNGTCIAEQLFEALKQFIDKLGEEERRGVPVGLNEEELAIFDLLGCRAIEKGARSG